MARVRGRPGVVGRRQAGVGEGGFRAKDPGLGPGAVVRTGRTLAGAWGGASEERRESLLRALGAGGS